MGTPSNSFEYAFCRETPESVVARVPSYLKVIRSTTVENHPIFNPMDFGIVPKLDELKHVPYADFSILNWEEISDDPRYKVLCKLVSHVTRLQGKNLKSLYVLGGSVLELLRKWTGEKSFVATDFDVFIDLKTLKQDNLRSLFLSLMDGFEGCKVSIKPAKSSCVEMVVSMPRKRKRDTDEPEFMEVKFDMVFVGAHVSLAFDIFACGLCISIGDHGATLSGNPTVILDAMNGKSGCLDLLFKSPDEVVTMIQKLAKVSNQLDNQGVFFPFALDVKKPSEEFVKIRLKILTSRFEKYKSRGFSFYPVDTANMSVMMLMILARSFFLELKSLDMRYPFTICKINPPKKLGTIPSAVIWANAEKAELVLE